MTTDAKETEVPSTSAPLPDTAAPATPVVEAPIADKGGETPAAPPAASAETPVTPTKVVDDHGDELTPEEQDVMARLTGQKTEEKTVVATPVATEKVETPPPAVETAEEIAGIKLPTSHELAGYKPETRKRIEQFTAKLKETEGPASAFTSLVDRFRGNGISPDQFHAWQDLGLDLRAKDPAVRQAAIESLHQIALKTGLKVETPEPDNAAVVAKIAELEKSLDLDPAHAEALRSALAARKPAAPKATEPPPVQQAPDPRVLVQQAVMQERVERAKYEAQESLAEAAAQVPVNDQAAFQSEVMAEIAKVEKGMKPEDLNNTMKWGSRMRAAAKTVLSRRQAQTPSTVLPNTKPFRPTTPNLSQSEEPKPGTEEYELGILTGKIQIKR
jgi:hypothetical protein